MNPFIAPRLAGIPGGFYKPLRAETGVRVDISADLVNTSAGVEYKNYT